MRIVAGICRVCLVAAAAFTLAACVPRIPRDALELRPESLALRQLQTRRYDTSDERNLLSAGALLLQDLGFTLEESEVKLGVVVGTKDRDATETGQVVGAIVVGVLTGSYVPIDRNQKIRAALVSRPAGDNSTNVRVTFQRIVWNTSNEISRLESVEDPELYQEFFDRLSKAVFLDAHQI